MTFQDRSRLAPEPRLRLILVLLLLILLAASLLRLYPISARSFWFDEAFTWRLIDYPWLEMLERATRDNSPPFYYFVLKAWSELFGTSVVGLRSLSLLCGLATIVGAYLFGVEAFRFGNEKSERRRVQPMGLLSAALVATSALQIRYSVEVRMYALAAALTVFSSWALLRALAPAGSRLRSWLLYALLATLLAYTHYYGLYTLAGHAVFTLLFLLAKANWNLLTFVRLPEVWDALTAAGLVFAAWLPWLRVFLNQEHLVRHSGWAGPVTGWDLAEICYRMFAVPEFVPRPAHETILYIVVPCLLGALLLCWRARAGDWLILCTALGPFVLCVIASKLGTQATTLRYFVMCQVFFLIGLAALVFRVRFVPERTIVAAAVLAGFGVITWDSFAAMDLPNRPGARAAVEFILRERRPGEPVIVASPLYYDPLVYHGHKPADFFIYTDGTPIPRHYGTAVLTPEELINDAGLQRLSAKRIWAVNMSSTYWGTRVVPPQRDWAESREEVFPDMIGVGDFHVVCYERRQPASPTEKSGTEK